ncbi:phosphate ABC transporter permease PtsA [Actinomadura craniellae]|uniref:Phosphate transport system permease protein PstA n=1 Tax=Actinomadura craniellae TaxID=2231787 RepID=A0A365GX32_9ACTN|nr:phosphate ABC transporter permease PstA [Actinomadura craniellae]RAY11384.1 phosphate ABC transporter permease PtsA [Actinomadura craniellae]
MTTQPIAAPRPAPRRRTRTGAGADLAEFAGAAVTSFAITWLIFARLMPFTVQAVGFAVCWYGLFLLAYWLITRDGHGPVIAADRVMGVLITTGALAAVTPILGVIGYVIYKGAPVLRLNFFTETLAVTGPLSAATEGGAMHSIIGTLEQLGVATLISVPLGVLTAVYLNEVRGPLTRPTRLVADAMTALPSIVAGLFVYSILILQFGWGFSGFAGSLALAVLMLPTVTITAEQVLRVVPGGLREASLALGAPQWRTVLMVVLPTARAGLSTAVILGMARVVGETAPMILTAFGSSTLNANVFSGQQDDLPLFVYNQVSSSQDTQVQRAWAGALVLLALVLVLFVLARLLGRPRTARVRRPAPKPATEPAAKPRQERTPR